MSTAAYEEQDFEDHIEARLLESGYHQRESSSYDKDLCLIPEEVERFIRTTQSKEYEKLKRQYGDQARQKLCYRIAQQVRRYGTLYVLRKGVSDRGANFDLVYYRPASRLNERHWELYRDNRLSVIRQLYHSEKRPQRSIDLGLFVNGLPVATAELKNGLTSTFAGDAVEQYKKRRDSNEPLFQFKRCLVHFAVGSEKVSMTTRLEGEDTYFLPFNKGIENPINPNGHKTAYLWEDILQPDTLLGLLQNYIHVEEKTKKVYDPQVDELTEEESEVLIFPRFHQLDVVRKLLRSAAENGPGHTELAMHSAGSGKSNSIAWFSHQAAKLYEGEAGDKRLFDSIIVVTDRNVLDRQIQETIDQAEKVPGRVKKIDKHSDQLRHALEVGEDIIITTIQKFPVISDQLEKLSGNRFAIVIDEAHSSQAGEYSKHLKKTLSTDLESAAEEEDFDVEDAVTKEIQTRGKQDHISYFAFTATPKDKTLELFGHRNAEGKPVPSHVYSMRQAIKEGFILDVLENYTTYRRYFKLAKSAPDDKQYDKKKATRLLTSYVDLQPHAIDVKTQIMLKHFMDVTWDAIQGQGRAMLVTRSRLHCVKYYQQVKKAVNERGLPFEPLVAFSGTVKDPDTGAEYTETSLNKLGRRTSIKEAFKLPKYRLLIVANKFQTGFDEPLLHTMYVDKKLGGVSAVQTLSRLNRKPKGKNTTVVLDFVNEAETIQSAFQRYYQTTMLEEETDPNKLYDLRTELDQFGLFTERDVNAFAAVFFDPSEPAEKLQPLLDEVVDRWKKRGQDEREDFRSYLQQYSRLYSYISQLIDFQDTGLEKLYVFARNLNRKLPRRKGHLPVEIQDEVDLDSFRIQETYSGSLKLEEEDAEISGIGTEVGEVQEDESEYLSSIVQTLNDTYGVELTEEDKVDLERMQEKLGEDEELKAVVNPKNSRRNMRLKFDEKVDNLLMEFLNTKLGLYKKLNAPSVNEALKRKWFDQFYREHRSS